MSAENEKVSIGSYLAFPGIMLSGQAIGKAKRAGSPIKAIAELKLDTKNFKNLNEALKNQGVDSFTRSTILKENYENLQKAVKQSKKLSKLSLRDKFLNLFRGNKVTTEGYKKAKEVADASISNVKAITKGEGKAFEAAVSAAKASSSGLVKTIGKNTLKEIKNPFTIAFTMLLEGIPEITQEVVPTFKEEGFGAGVKQLAKSSLKLAGSLFSFAFGNSAGSAIGAYIGSIVPGVGNAVGAFIGGMIGMTLTGKVTDKVVNKITGKDNKKDIQPENIEQNQQNIQENKPNMILNA